MATQEYNIFYDDERIQNIQQQVQEAKRLGKNSILIPYPSDEVQRILNQLGYSILPICSEAEIRWEIPVGEGFLEDYEIMDSVFQNNCKRVGYYLANKDTNFTKVNRYYFNHRNHTVEGHCDNGAIVRFPVYQLTWSDEYLQHIITDKETWEENERKAKLNLYYKLQKELGLSNNN